MKRSRPTTTTTGSTSSAKRAMSMPSSSERQEERGEVEATIDHTSHDNGEDYGTSIASDKNNNDNILLAASGGVESSSSSASSSTVDSSSSSVLASDTMMMLEEEEEEDDDDDDDAAAAAAAATSASTPRKKESLGGGGSSDSRHHYHHAAVAAGNHNNTNSNSLFGAVMNHVQESDQHRGHSSGGSGGSGNGSDHPTTYNTTSSLEVSAEAREAATTASFAEKASPAPAAASPAPAAAAAMMMSPGGFQLMDFVNTVSSPFFVHQKMMSTPNNKNKNDNMSPPPPGGVGSLSSSSSMMTPKQKDQQQQQREWQDIDATTIPFIDWSIKRNLTIEYGDTTCKQQPQQPHHSFSSYLRKRTNARIQQQAKMNFVTTTNATTTKGDGALKWHSALLYWSYPTGGCDHNHDVIPVNNHNNNKNPPVVNNNDTNKDGIIDEASQLTLWSTTGGNNNNNNNQLTNASFSSASTGAAQQQQRQQLRQWQQSYRSLYLTWIQRVQQLSSSSSSRRRQQHLEKDESRDGLDDPDECYFYVCGQGHVVLFSTAAAAAAAAIGVTEDGGNDTYDDSFQPQVILSSSTIGIRTKLRQMGVKMFLVDDDTGHLQECPGDDENDGKKDGKENDDAQKTKNMDKKDHPIDDSATSPGVKAELVALRRAQVFGSTVGADVTVSIKNSKPAAAAQRTKQRQQINNSPTLIRGFDNCAAFFEVYLNSIIMDLSSEQVRCHHQHQLVLPTLVCRKLGPFLHSSLNTLKVQFHNNNNQVQFHNNNNRQDIVSVQGIVLPDCLREMIGASIQLAEEEQQESEGSHHHHPNHESNNNEPSHYMIFHAEVHEGTPPAAPVQSGGSYPSSNNNKATTIAPLSRQQGTIGRHNSQWINLHDDDNNRTSTNAKAKAKPNRVANSVFDYQHCPYGQALSTAVWDSTRPSTIAYKVNSNWGLAGT